MSFRSFDAFNFVELSVLNAGAGPSDGPNADELERLREWTAKNGKSSVHVSGAKNAEELEVSILGVIGGGYYFGGISARSVKDLLDANKNAKKIRAIVDSPGGDYFDGVAIMNLFKRHAASVTIEIIGEASSAASVISMGGDRIEMHTGTVMMIHRAWSFAMGNGDELRSYAQLLDKVDTGLLDLYVARTGKSAEDVKALVDATTWMTAKEAVDDGFADAVLPAKAKKPTDPAPSQKAGVKTPSSPAAKVRPLSAFRP